MQFSKILMISMLLFLNLYAQGGRLESDFYGYTEYEIIEEKNEAPIEKKEDLTPPRTITDEYLKTLNAKQIRDLKKELLDIATIEPTDENIKNHLKLQKFIDSKATNFMNRVQIVTKDNQDLDISVDIKKSKFGRNIQAIEKKEKLRKFYEKNINKFVLVVFFNINEDIYNQSIERVMQYVNSDMPIEIRYIDIESDFGKKFAKEKNIIHTPDTWISFKDNNNLIWERLFTGIPTKDKIYQMIDFVYEMQIKPKLKGVQDAD